MPGFSRALNIMQEIKNWILSILIAGAITITAIDLKGDSVSYIPINHGPEPQVIQLVNVKKALPVRLIIPELMINSQIEYVSEDAEGRMDVPSNYDNVGWYSVGTIPGELGQSVIAGHLDSVSGPAVFEKLNDLQVGDTVEIQNDIGGTLKFEVYKKELYKDINFPIAEVFGESTFAGLNLITCAGTFDRGQKNYSDRLVVYTRLIQ
jgi:sortase A